MAQIKVKLSDIPNVLDIEFKDTSYFKKWESLPTPLEVRAQALKQHQSGTITDSRKLYLPQAPYWNPPPVLFRAKNLWVKWGRVVRLSEAKSLYIIRKFLSDSFPAPEIYGWHQDDSEVFIYCEWLEGPTLEQAWGSMDDDNRIVVSRQLRLAIETLRRLHQDPQEQFVGELLCSHLTIQLGRIVPLISFTKALRTIPPSLIAALVHSHHKLDPLLP